MMPCKSEMSANGSATAPGIGSPRELLAERRRQAVGAAHILFALVGSEPVDALGLGPADRRVTLPDIVHQRHAEAARRLDARHIGDDRRCGGGSPIEPEDVLLVPVGALRVLSHWAEAAFFKDTNRSKIAQGDVCVQRARRFVFQELQ